MDATVPILHIRRPKAATKVVIVAVARNTSTAAESEDSMEWHDLDMFTRAMFIIGFLVSVFVVGCLFGALLCWVENKIDIAKVRRKSISAKARDATDWLTYDITGATRRVKTAERGESIYVDKKPE